MTTQRLLSATSAAMQMAFKKAEKAGEITEDELADLTEKMQKLTDKTIERVDKAVEEKTKEIMTV